MPKYDNIETRTWSDFYHYLDEKNKSEHFKEEELIDCFLSYLKIVCNVIKINKMDLSSLKSLANFNNLIDKVINNIEGYQSPNFDNKVSNIDYYRYGKYFSMTKLNSDYTIWPWLGLYFTVENLMIYIEINEDWCKKEYDFLAKNEIKDGHYFNAPYFDEEYRTSYCFEMKEDIFKKFNNSNSVEEQETILKCFLMETIDAIQND